MKWKFWIQEKLYCTTRELNALFMLLVVIIVAHGIHILRAGSSPFDDAFYAETDSLFQQLSARAAHLEAVDTVFTGFSNPAWLAPSAGAAAKRDRPELHPFAEVEEWIFKDTLEKPVVRFPLNVNTATEKELQALPRIGPAMARRIIEHRQKQPFKSVNDLLAVRGIGVKTLEKLAPLIVIEDQPVPDSLR